VIVVPVAQNALELELLLEPELPLEPELMLEPELEPLLFDSDAELDDVLDPSPMPASPTSELALDDDAPVVDELEVAVVDAVLE